MAIFFALTSYVLMMSLERLKKSSNQLYIDFITRRFFRIYPLAVFFVIFYALTKLPAYYDGGKGAMHAIQLNMNIILQNILLVQNFTIEDEILEPMWSLPYEFQMYLLLPLIFTFIGSADSKWRSVFLFFILCLSFFVATDKMESIN